RSLLAVSYYSQKEFEPASREFEKLIAAQPDNPTVQYLLAESYLWSGQEQQMLDFFGHVLEKSPNSVTVHMLLGEANDGPGANPAARGGTVVSQVSPRPLRPWRSSGPTEGI